MDSFLSNAFDFIKTNKGLCTEESYPYKGVDGTCNKKCKDDSKATVKTHTDVAANAKALMSAIAKQPVSIAIEADQSSFQFYIFDTRSRCRSKKKCKIRREKWIRGIE